jgi:hypothetical protein
MGKKSTTGYGNSLIAAQAGSSAMSKQISERSKVKILDANTYYNDILESGKGFYLRRKGK